LELGEQFGVGSRARIIDEAVDRLDSSVLEAAYQGVGDPAFPPTLMLKMILFEVLDGRLSPAQWCRDGEVHKALLWLGRGIQPSRTACYSFRDRLGSVIDQLHKLIIDQTLIEENVNPDIGVLDGTTIRAFASRHRLVNQETLVRRREKLQVQIEADVANPTAASATDLPKWMPKTHPGRVEQAQRMDEAKEILEQRLQGNAKKPKDKRLSENHVRVSVSEPEAPLGRDKEKVFCPLYTAEFLVEPSSLLVISWDVFAQATDAGTLAPMIDHTQSIVDGKLKKVIADAGYVSVLDLQACQERNIELVAPVQENSFTKKKEDTNQIGRDKFHWSTSEQTYVCPQGHQLDYRGKQRKRRRGDQHIIEHRYHCSPQHCQGCPLAGLCVRDATKGRTIKRLEGQDLLDCHREKMKGDDAKMDYKQRGAVIERAFADIKRNRSFCRFNGRGLARAKTQVGLVVLAQNILTAHRLCQIRANEAKCET
jgi:transposase